MRAVLLHGPYDIRVEDVDKPSPSRGEVVIRVKAAGICGTDLHSYRGKHPFLRPPRIPGHEFSGYVAEIGEGVTGIEVGERVVVEPLISCGRCDACIRGEYNVCRNLKVLGVHVDGAFAEYVKVPAEKVYRLPKGVSYEDGALIEPLAVAVHVTRRGKIGLGDSIAILGSGPIGLLIAQVARCAGARRIIMTDVLGYRLRLAERLGADVTINAKDEDPVRRILEETNNMGVDVAIEAAGAPPTPAQALRVTKPHGRVVIIGFFEMPSVQLNILDIVAKELHVYGSRVYWHDFATAIELLSEDKIDVRSLVTHKYRLEEAKEAFEVLDKKIGRPIKVLLTL
ncbi:MAG: zinc-binding alcohol dehydrogenase family protein [Thermoprotei archaeon]|nr:zinc-binding alcohol dehydrogenase family protein [Thermoprotei archaeon]